MDDIERFLFDCQGFIRIPRFLSSSEVELLLNASKRLEEHALACEKHSPKFRAIINFEYWQNQEFGYFATYADTNSDNRTLVVDDFWLFSEDFDFLVGHVPTMRYVERLINSKSYRHSGP